MKEKSLRLVKSILSHKKVLLGIAFAAFLFAFMPFQFAAANIFGDILGAITNIGAAIFFGPAILGITAALYFLAFLAAWLASVLIEVIKVVALSSLSIPVLPNSGIEVVTVGWTFTRDFVNLLFILILVFIGLATILRIQSYQLQKTLPLLIMVALLVNFSGVFVGFIVDMANLVTSVFVQKIQGASFALDSTVAIGKSVVQSLLEFVTRMTDIGAIVVPAAKAVVFLIFYATFSLILFIVMLLFIVRVGFLWLLTILAPLAFAAYILPATKRLTGQWFQQLIQWAIIGIPMTFFLWLAQKAILGAPEILAAFRGIGPDIVGPDPGLAQLIMSFTGPVVALLILGAGVMISMQFAPATSKAIINIGKSKTGRRFFRQALAGTGTFAWTRKVPRTGGKTVGETIGGIGTSVRGLGEKWEEKAGRRRPWTAWTKQFGSAIEIGAGKVSEQITKGKKADATEAEKAARSKSEFENTNNMNLELQKPPMSQNMENLVGVLGGITDNGDPDDHYDAMNPGNDEKGDLKPKRFEWKHMPRIFEAAVRLGPPFYRKIAKANIGRLPELGALVERYKNNPESLVREIFDKTEEKDIKSETIPKQYLNPYYENPNDPHASERAAWVIDNLVNTGLTNPRVGPALLETKREVRENVVNYLQTKDIDWFIANRAERLLRASRNSPGLQTLGVAHLLPGVKDDDINVYVELREEAKKNAKAAAMAIPGTAEAQAEEIAENTIRARAKLQPLIPDWMRAPAPGAPGAAGVGTPGTPGGPGVGTP